MVLTEHNYIATIMLHRYRRILKLIIMEKSLKNKRVYFASKQIVVGKRSTQTRMALIKSTLII